MKRSLLFLGAGLMLLASCQREVFPETPLVPQTPEKPAISFKVDAVAEDLPADPDSKTFIDEDLLVRWASGEYMRLVVQTDTDSPRYATSLPATADWDGQTSATFEFSLGAFAGSPSTYTLAGVYPASAVVGDGTTLCNVYLPSTQNASAASYDPSAYILLAKPESFGELPENWTAVYRRATALNKITLSNLDDDIYSVTVTATGKALAGRRHFDLTTATAGSVYNSESASITVHFAQPQHGTVTVWFTSWEAVIGQGEPLTVVAQGISNTYTRTINAREGGISFLEGKLNTLGINMASAAVEPLTDFSGYYLIASLCAGNGEYAGKWQVMNYEPNPTYHNYFLHADTQILGSANANPAYSDLAGGLSNPGYYVWQVVRNGLGYELLNAYTGQYLALTENENRAYVVDTPCEESLFYLSGTDNGEKGFTDVHIDSPLYTNRRLQFNSNAGQTRFAFYTTTQTAIRLVKAPAMFLGTLSTGHPLSVGATSATLTAQYENIDLTQAPTDVRILWGYTADYLDHSLFYASAITTRSGSFSVNLSGLAEGYTYYYKAEMTVYDPTTGGTRTLQGSVISFTTGVSPSGGWLELPAIPNSWSISADYYGSFYGTGSQVGTNRNYSYHYNYNKYASLWVAYPLCANHFNVSRTREDNWDWDPNVEQEYQVTVTGGSYGKMYGNSNYARGHQIPNADRKRDDLMNLQTFYVTNQTPQWQNGFNSGMWSSLEGAARDLVSGGSDTLYVATGPVYQRQGYSDTVNYLSAAAGKGASPASLAIPNFFWKAFLKVTRSGSTVVDACTIGFWFENRNYADSDYAGHTMSVNEIETLTGIDLFANLPDALENDAEDNNSWSTFQYF